MPVEKLPNLVACVGVVGSAMDASSSRQMVTVAFNTEEGDRCLLPLSEAAVEQFLKVISAWRRVRDFEEPSALEYFLANKLIA